MYIGKDLLFPESDIYVLKNSETLQDVYSPIRFETEATFNCPVTFLDTMKSMLVYDPSDPNYDPNKYEVEISGKLKVGGASKFNSLITGTITAARWS